jgi:hypothetical protein
MIQDKNHADEMTERHSSRISTYVALPSLTKTQETVKLRDAETIFFDETVIFSFTGC